MCSVGSASLTAALPLSGGNAPGNPSPPAWWQAAQLAVNTASPCAICAALGSADCTLGLLSAAWPALPPEGAARAVGAAAAASVDAAVELLPPALAGPPSGGCFRDRRYATSAWVLWVGITTPCAGAKPVGIGTGFAPGGARSTTRNIHENDGMIDSGTTLRGLYRCMYCQTSLPRRVPTFVRSGPVRSEPRSSGV